MKPVNYTPADHSLKGTETLKNLVAAYAAESMAYSRYMFYASQAEKEGYPPVAEVFTETADKELHHAKVFFKFLEDGAEVPVDMSIPAGVIGNTSDNLKEAAREEEAEGVDAYMKAAAKAREEDFPEVAEHFEAIASIENLHKDRFDALRKLVDSGKRWKRDKPIKWQCTVCGYVSEGTEPPEKCPACDHPYKYSKPEEEDY